MEGMTNGVAVGQQQASGLSDISAQVQQYQQFLGKNETWSIEISWVGGRRDNAPSFIWLSLQYFCGGKTVGQRVPVFYLFQENKNLAQIKPKFSLPIWTNERKVWLFIRI